MCLPSSLPTENNQVRSLKTLILCHSNLYFDTILQSPKAFKCHWVWLNGLLAENKLTISVLQKKWKDAGRPPFYETRWTGSQATWTILTSLKAPNIQLTCMFLSILAGTTVLTLFRGSVLSSRQTWVFIIKTMEHNYWQLLKKANRQVVYFLLVWAFMARSLLFHKAKRDHQK